jgi:hypothetical protein
MTDELESILRTELGRAAEHAPKAPPRFPSGVVSRSNRRRTVRKTVAACAFVTAIAVPIGLVAMRGGAEGGDIATSTIAQTSPAAESIAPTLPPPNFAADEYRIGEVLAIDNPSQNRPIHLWYAKTGDGTVLCERVHSRGGGSTETCGERLGAEEATEQGSTESFPRPATGQVLYYGTAGDEVARVTALTDEGKVTGTLHRPDDSPQGIWTVTVPADRTVTAFEFAGREGETTTRIERQRSPVPPEATAETVGPTLDMPGKLTAVLVKTPDKTLVWKLNGQAVAMNGLTPGRAIVERGGPDKPLIDMGGRPMNVALREHKEHWFGITSAETTRVELVFKDGTTVKATTKRDPWKLGDFRLFAGTQQHSEDMYRDGFQLVGYGKDGAELWREDHSEPRVSATPRH